MAEGQEQTQEFLGTLEIQIVEDIVTGLTHYYCIDHEDQDPNGEPVIYELTASEYNDLSSQL